MASQVKTLSSDISSSQKKTLLTNIVKYGLSQVINQSAYKSLLESNKKDLSDIVKDNEFR